MLTGTLGAKSEAMILRQEHLLSQHGYQIIRCGFTTTPMAEAVELQMSLQTAQAQPCLGCCSR